MSEWATRNTGVERYCRLGKEGKVELTKVVPELSFVAAHVLESGLHVGLQLASAEPAIVDYRLGMCEIWTLFPWKFDFSRFDSEL